ncbi:bifunctional nuclease family protein [Spirosoma flavum]|uniref:Bifunctional nuclease family protein n=1 Tax=Spirosoma flavum TaxID=2048557 RepID=A0ABW6AI33_9BACT
MDRLQTMIDLSIIALSESISKPGNYALILEDVVGKRRIPLIIGTSEAQAIAVAMEKMQPLRPFTHDLFYQTLKQTGIIMKEAVITRVQDEIFYAHIVLLTPVGATLVMDARPSDAIALAVRFDCPLRATLDVVETSGYFIDDKVRDKKGSYAEYTMAELEELLARIIKKEDYESAARVRDAIDKRKG